MSGQITEPKAALTFILGGKSFVTLVSLKSGNRYTYKIELADKRNPTDTDTWFVSLLMGPDNWSNYKYIGMIKDKNFRWTSRSKVAQDAPSLLGFNFVFYSLQADTMSGFEVWHEGKCGRCGKKLTVPESIASGFGPDCLEMVGAAAMAAAPVAVVAQPNLNFDGSVRQRVRKSKGVLLADGKFVHPGGVLVKCPAVAVAGTAAPVVSNVGELDAMIRARIVTYRSEAPENYYQDGELDEQQAFNVAYNKFRVQIERESRS